MKRVLVFCLLALTASTVSSCDFFRKLAGRPTSAEIELKRAEIERMEQAHFGRIDSLKSTQKQISDSLAVLDSIRNSKYQVIASHQISAETKARLRSRYYIIVGAFSQRENAQKLASRAELAGFQAELIKYRNGYTAVGLCPSNNLSAAYSSMQRLQSQPFCPKDAWILDNE